MAGLIASFLGLFGCGRDRTSQYKMTRIYRDLRQQALAFNPSEIGLTPTTSSRVWGIVMDWGVDSRVATLVALGDGSVSLYYSTGGGIIGAGVHDGPRRAGQALLAAAPGFVSQAEHTTDFPLPERGKIRFYFLTFDGVLTVEAPADELERHNLPMSPLADKAQDVITEILATEKVRDQQQREDGTDKPRTLRRKPNQ